MIFEMHNDEAIEKVKSFLKENAIMHEVRDDTFDSWDGINIYDTLTAMFGKNPSFEGNDVVDLIYQRVPTLVEKLNKVAIHDISYGVEDSPYLTMKNQIREYYTKAIEDELELMVDEGVIERVTE